MLGSFVCRRGRFTVIAGEYDTSTNEDTEQTFNVVQVKMVRRLSSKRENVFRAEFIMLLNVKKMSIFCIVSYMSKRNN